jgi:ribosomal-protein-alanine N-acetyltransferase
MKIRIEKSQPKDAKDIVHIHYDAVHKLGASAYSQKTLDRWDIGPTKERVRIMEEHLLTTKLVFLSAKDEKGNVLGYTTLVPENNELRALYVYSKFSGKGVGKALMQAAEEKAKQLKLNYLQLRSSLNAKEFYKSLGFEERFPMKHQWGDIKMQCIAMRKILSPDFNDYLPLLETERLLLRPVRQEDAENIYDYGKNPKSSEYTLWNQYKSINDAHSFIENYIFPNYEKNIPEPIAICWKEKPDELIGMVGCFWASEKNKCMELAYVVNPKHWGQGVCTEAAKALVDFCFKRFDVQRIQAQFKAPNIASGKVMEKIGMSFEGVNKSACFHKEQFWDMHMYATTREDWQK